MFILRKWCIEKNIWSVEHHRLIKKVTRKVDER